MMSDNKFEPYVFHNYEGGEVEVFFADCSYYGECINEGLTIYRSNASDCLIGAAIYVGGIPPSVYVVQTPNGPLLFSTRAQAEYSASCEEDISVVKIDATKSLSSHRDEAREFLTGMYESPVLDENDERDYIRKFVADNIEGKPEVIREILRTADTSRLTLVAIQTLLSATEKYEDVLWTHQGFFDRAMNFLSGPEKDFGKACSLMPDDLVHDPEKIVSKTIKRLELFSEMGYKDDLKKELSRATFLIMEAHLPEREKDVLMQAIHDFTPPARKSIWSWLFSR